MRAGARAEATRKARGREKHDAGGKGEGEGRGGRGVRSNYHCRRELRLLACSRRTPYAAGATRRGGRRGAGWV